MSTQVTKPATALSTLLKLAYRAARDTGETEAWTAISRLLAEMEARKRRKGTILDG